MVMELVPGKGQRVSAVLSVEETIIGVLVAGDTDGGEVIVVDPDPGGFINVDEILTLGGAVEFDVADDNIVGLPDLKATVGDTCRGANTQNTGIADDLNNATSCKSAINLDDTPLFCSGCQTGAVADSYTSTTASTCGTSGKTDELIDGSSPLLHRSSLRGAGGRKYSSNLEETHVDGW